MSSISIRNGLLDGKEASVYVEDHLIMEVGKPREADRVINARGKLILPGLVNTHTHGAMTLLKGYADDMELMPWLNTKIWPMEKFLTPEHNYWGTRLACLEMIKTGTLSFNDMYINMEQAARAVADAGIRAVLGYGFIDAFNEEKREAEIKGTENFVNHAMGLNNPRITPSVCPHAVYTVSDPGLEWCAKYAREKGILLHIHLAETEDEVKGCMEQRGDTPVCHLDKIGFLGPDVVAAHSVWLDQEEISILAKKGVKPSHNPVSNMKMGVGKAMPYRDMRNAGICPTLGTDGSASNNSLDMFQSMKFAALLQKFRGQPTALPCQEALLMATKWGAEALRIPTGEIKEGLEADIILVETKRHDMVPGHNPISNLVYSSSSSSVSHAICRGKLVMDDRKVEGEDIVLKKAQQAASELAKNVDAESKK